MHGLAVVLYFTAILGSVERDPGKVERWASELIELCTRQSFALWLAGGEVLRGWARSVSGSAAEGFACIEDGIRDFQAPGGMLSMPYLLALKAEALHLSGRTREALNALNHAEAFAERSEERWCCAELHRLRGVFLAALGAGQVQIEAAFQEAIRTGKQQKSISLEARAEASYVAYRGRKTNGPRNTQPLPRI
jgi:predicted ATPase